MRQRRVIIKMSPIPQHLLYARHCSGFSTCAQVCSYHPAGSLGEARGQRWDFREPGSEHILQEPAREEVRVSQ